MPAARAKKRPRVGPGRLSAEQTAELPDRLLDAAFLQFTEHGYADATMDQIAKRAGASTKTLYSRFSNKSEMLEAVVRRNVQRTIADHLRSFALAPQDTEPREYLYKFAVQVCVSLQTEETSGMTRVTLAEGHRFPVLARLYREVTGRAVTAIAEALNVWREQGKVNFEGNTERLAELAFNMMTSEPRIHAALGDPVSGARLENQLRLAVDVFLKGIEPARGSARPKRK